MQLGRGLRLFQRAPVSTIAIGVFLVTVLSASGTSEHRSPLISDLMSLPGVLAPDPEGRGRAHEVDSAPDESTPTFMRPVTGKLSSGYGPRDGGMHTGLDIDADTGTPVAAADEGRVVLAETYFGYGATVIINHGDSISTLYGHLSDTKVGPGDRVRRGQVIGLAGCTGDCTGDHLHFEVRISDRPVPPRPFLHQVRSDPLSSVPLDPGYAPLPGAR